MDLKGLVAEELERVRRRSLDLLAPLSDDDLVAQHSPLMSPLVWDLAHVANYEDMWLVRALGADGVGAHLDDLYDAFRHPRRERPSLPLLGPAEARAYGDEVRRLALDVLDHLPGDAFAPDGPEELLRHAFVHGMVVQHEHQHDETMLATIQLMQRPYEPAAATHATPTAPGTDDSDDEVLVPGGPFALGTDGEPWALDNERPAHVVDLPPFFVDTTAVTNGAYAEFVANGGYDDPRWWHPEGWKWRQETGAEHPGQWRRAGGGSWARDRFGWVEDLPVDEPVQHVCWYEADAYARWRGKRLPTEAEWEKAASWDPATGRATRYPWGDEPPAPAHANVGQRRFGPAPAGAHPDGASPVGCRQMIGDVWEWTASDFSAWPGFRSFPYREYSEVFFGPEYKVLRGGSWATDATAVRATFRNWDYPIRRQIFSGFRCARDA